MSLVLLLAACGGKDPCPSRRSEERDHCLADLATSQFPTQPESALALAMDIQDDALRDLVLLDGVRTSERDFCEHIRDRGLRISCGTTITRPHLRDYQPGAVSNALAVTVLAALEGPARQQAAACADLAGSTLEQCLFRVVDRCPDPAVASVICDAIPTAEIQGQCLATLSERLSRGNEIAAAAAACDSIREERWRGECRFRLSEELPADQWQQSARYCAQAGEFHDQCTVHLVSRQALVRAQQVGPVSFRQALVKLEGDLAELGSVVSRGGALPPQTQLFWMCALHGLVTEATLHGSLLAWRGLGAGFAASDPRGQQFDDLWLLMWYRLRLQTAMGEEKARAVRLDALREALSNEDLHVPLQTWDQAPLYAPEREPGFTDEPYAPGINKPGPPLAVRFSLAAVPWPLHPDSQCDLSQEDRATVVAIWALHFFPWSYSRAILPEVLQHDNPAVRGYALDATWQMDSETRHEEVARPSWLVDAVETLAREETHPAIQGRARQIAEAFGKGIQVPPATGEGLDLICRPADRP